jgi:predicted RNase H-like HicB family nuclease
MFAGCIQAALEKAQYKLIDNGDEPYFVDVPELDGVSATGRIIEDARRNFIEALEDWIAALCCGFLPSLRLESNYKRLKGADICCLSSLQYRGSELIRRLLPLSPRGWPLSRRSLCLALRTSQIGFQRCLF